MKRSVKVLSFVLILVLMLGTTTVFFSAASEPYNYKVSDWSSYWQNIKGDNTSIVLNVGADETEMNFVWHRAKTNEVPKLHISKNKNMTDFVEFIGYNSKSENKDQVVSRVTAKELESDTVYYYTCGSGENWSDITPFTTGVADTAKFMFVSDIQVVGDDDESMEYCSKTWNTMLENALDTNDDVEFILSAGDLINSGTSSDEWAGTISPLAMRSLPFATVPGNHDNKGTIYRYYVNTPNNYKMLSTSKMGANDYYFRNGDVLFLMIDAMNTNIFGHYNFLKKAISENADAKWRVVSFHQDVYGSGHHAAQGDNDILQVVLSNILDDFDIDVVLNGHEHIYSRSYFMKDNKVVNGIDYTSNSVVDPDGTIYITANNAGGRERYDDPDPYPNMPWVNVKYLIKDTPLYSMIEFDDNTFTLNTYRGDNNEKIDAYTITKTEGNTLADVDLDKNVLQTGIILDLFKLLLSKMF